ncbi:MAG TPA: SUMF1/EgtB/PvdO family nonheme iron enzyme [Puia sp.]
MLFAFRRKAIIKWLRDSTASWRWPNGKSRGGIEKRLDHPVTTISYRDVQAYCAWAGVRLPTLEEWEVACRSAVSSPIPGGCTMCTGMFSSFAAASSLLPNIPGLLMPAAAPGGAAGIRVARPLIEFPGG